MLARCIILFNKKIHNKPIVIVHAPLLEIIWTLIPALILLFVAIPSFSLLYSIDEIIEPTLTIKVIGHQWYWSYEFLDPNILFRLYYDFIDQPQKYTAIKVTCSFDSYMLSDEIIAKNFKKKRLLEVDNKLYLPIETNIRLLITSADVLHSWAIPSLGVKLDAVPGRLNQASLYIKRPGIFNGQCSEICGINHAFMPISVVGLDILGNGSKIQGPIVDSISPLFTMLLGRSLEKQS